MRFWAGYNIPNQECLGLRDVEQGFGGLGSREN